MPPNQPTPSPLPGSKLLLVVDDVGIVRRVTARMLSEDGYRVFEAASAAEALEVLRTARRPVDLLVTDVSLPDVNGVALVQMVQEQSPATRVLFMSAYPAEVLAREGLTDLDVHFLAKPFTREELLRKVYDALTAPLEKNGQDKENGRESNPRPQRG